MRALTYHGKRDVRVDTVPDPTIQEPTDAIIKVTSTAICGSDLHLYEVLGMFMTEGDILGHEPMGIVEEVGTDVRNIAPGDRVVVPFNISCGHCFMCQRQLFAQCETTQVRASGKGAALFGYSKLYGSVPGGQAEYLRVPQAQFGPIKVPAEHPDDRFLFLSDVIPTAWQAVAYADVPAGGTLAVLGLGPIGQFCVRIARQLGVERVLAVDLVSDRLTLAGKYGAETIDRREVDDVAEALIQLTGGRGPDAIIDAVGMEAHGSPAAKAAQTLVGMLPGKIAAPLTEHGGVDRLDGLHTAVRAVRRGGTVSVIGVYGGEVDPMPMMEIFDRGVQLRVGQAHVKRWVDHALPLLLDDADPLGTADFVTHRLPLEDGPRAYEMFQKKQDGCVKAVLVP